MGAPARVGPCGPGRSCMLRGARRARRGGRGPPLTPDLVKALGEARYVYIQSERKGGEFGKPAEIWFFVDGGTRSTSAPGRRRGASSASRPAAPRRASRSGSPGGPSFEATGKLVKDPALEAKLMAAFAKKYPDGWATHADGFREGFRTGERVLVAYTPALTAAAPWTRAAPRSPVAPRWSPARAPGSAAASPARWRDSGPRVAVLDLNAETARAHRGGDHGAGRRGAGRAGRRARSRCGRPRARGDHGQLGPVDVLVNNAGGMFAATFLESAAQGLAGALARQPRVRPALHAAGRAAAGRRRDGRAA